MPTYDGQLAKETNDQRLRDLKNQLMEGKGGVSFGPQQPAQGYEVRPDVGGASLSDPPEQTYFWMSEADETKLRAYQDDVISRLEQQTAQVQDQPPVSSSPSHLPPTAYQIAPAQQYIQQAYPAPEPIHYADTSYISTPEPAQYVESGYTNYARTSLYPMGTEVDHKLPSEPTYVYNGGHSQPSAYNDVNYPALWDPNQGSNAVGYRQNGRNHQRKRPRSGTSSHEDRAQRQGGGGYKYGQGQGEKRFKGPAKSRA